jgi:hypothetical protein
MSATAKPSPNTAAGPNNHKHTALTDMTNKQVVAAQAGGLLRQVTFPGPTTGACPLPSAGPSTAL